MTRQQLADRMKKDNPRLARFSDDALVDAYVNQFPDIEEDISDYKTSWKDVAGRLKAQYPQFKNVPDDILMHTYINQNPKAAQNITDAKSIPDRPRTAFSIPFSAGTVRSKLPIPSFYPFADWVTKQLPYVGSGLGFGLGTLLSGGLGGEGVGAVIGGMAGKDQENALRERIFGELAPQTVTERLQDVGIEGAKQGALALGTAGLGWAGGKLARPLQEWLMSYGLRSGEMMEGGRLSNLMPDLQRVATRLGFVGKGATVPAMRNVIADTNTVLESEFKQALAPLAKQDGLATRVNVVQALRDRIMKIPRDPVTGRAFTAADQELMSTLEDRALEFSKNNWNIGQLNDQRMTVSKYLRSWYNKTGSDAQAAIRTDADLAADKIIEKVLRDDIYGLADKAGGYPPGYIQGLKEKQAALFDLADKAQQTSEKLHKATYEQLGAGPGEKIRAQVRSYMPTGGPLDPLKAANERLALMFPEPSPYGALRKYLPPQLQPPGSVRDLASAALLGNRQLGGLPSNMGVGIMAGSPTLSPVAPDRIQTPADIVSELAKAQAAKEAAGGGQ